MKNVLTVQAANQQIPLPAHYDGWRNERLATDARQLQRLQAGAFDAVFCSHFLHHHHRADGARVLEGFAHLLKPDGFAEIRVPDVGAAMNEVVQNGLDLDDSLYSTAEGPVLVRDLFYGVGSEFGASKTGFTTSSLLKFAAGRGFNSYALGPPGQFEIVLFLFKEPMSAQLPARLGLTAAVADAQTGSL